MRLLIIRHADPDYANDSLTPAGRLEAEALAERMVRQGVDQLYCSPLGRARETARYTAERVGKSPEVLDWTRELSHWRIDEKGLGRTCVWDVHGHTVRRLPSQPTRDDWHTHPPFDNEVFRSEFDSLGREADAFLARQGFKRDDRVYRVTRENRDRVALFCHGGLGLTLLSHLLDVPLPLMWAGFFMPPSSVTTVLFDERGDHVAVPRCIGLADVSHLYRAGLPVQPSGIRANFH